MKAATAEQVTKALYDEAIMELFYLQRLNASGGRLELVFKEY
jgi:hypothetical protein